MKSRILYHHLIALTCFAVLNLFGPSLAIADDTVVPDIDASKVSITTIEPERDVGYTVGDILVRTVTLTVKKPYALDPTTLPIVGYEHRYKGQVIGVELRSINFKQDQDDQHNFYTMQLAYQVFTNNIVAKPSKLPAEIVKFHGEGKVVQYRIPSWPFRISPLAVYGSVKIETDMSPLRGPLLLDSSPEKLRVKVLTVILAFAAFGLLYILGSVTWLPRMGGPFARACRDLRKLPATPEGLQQAVARVHQSLNDTASGSVFSDTLDAFLAKKPGFIPIKTDIQRFFGLSRQVFFEPQAAHEVGQEPLVWLKTFCRHCRDCERGLIPETKA